MTYSYDAFGRMTEESNNSVTSKYTYDVNSNLIQYTMTAPNSTSVTYNYTYDAGNRRTRETILGKSIAYTYTPNGNIKSKNAGGIVSDYSYNDAGLVTGLTIKNGSTYLNNFQYTYSLDGNILTDNDTVNNTNKTYTYDNIGQLKKEVQTGAVSKTYSYSYDNTGNRTQKAESGVGTTTYSYDLNNRLESQTTVSGGTTLQSTSYTYDNNGNQTYKKTVYQSGTTETKEYIYA